MMETINNTETNLTENNLAKRVYCLYRVSTKKQVDKQKDDIPMQKIACQDFVNRQGWVIAKEFYEKSVSGFKVLGYRAVKLGNKTTRHLISAADKSINQS